MLSLFFNLIILSSAYGNTDSANEPIVPIPQNISIANKDKVELGRALFLEKKLSKNSTISCSSCHDLNRFGVDHLPVSVGVGGASGEMNSPTIFNSAYNFRQFWDGRAKSLEEQVGGPLEHPKEMGSTWKDVVQRLKSDAQYNKKFTRIYSDGVTQNNVADAISAFERVLTTPNSPFDRFLRGNPNAINAIEKSGYKKFKSYGCIACHQGMNVGGNMYQTMGIMGDYFKDRTKPIRNSDLGRFQITGKPSDKHVFKVPSLRNVASTAPYFHDGSVDSLEAAVETMARYQLGRKISQQDIEEIVAFLKTLSGERPAILERLPAGKDL